MGWSGRALRGSGKGPGGGRDHGGKRLVVKARGGRGCRARLLNTSRSYPGAMCSSCVYMCL